MCNMWLNISTFVSLPWKLDNPYDHNVLYIFKEGEEGICGEDKSFGWLSQLRDIIYRHYLRFGTMLFSSPPLHPAKL